MQTTQTTLTSRPLKPVSRIKSEEDFVNEMMYRLTAPIICWPGYEEDVTPEQMEKARIAKLVKPSFSDKECTDYEAALYCSHASLVNPMTQTGYKIYMTVFRSAFPEQAQQLFGDPSPADTLQEYEEADLHRFKQWIFRKQMDALKAKMKDEKAKVKPVIAELTTFL